MSSSPDGRPQSTVLETREIDLDGQRLRVATTAVPDGGVPLLFFNGIGANLELVEPFVARLKQTGAVVFDAPGVGGSPVPPMPYRLRQLASLADRLMTRLGWDRVFDVLGVSWGGALAQQFAHQFPRRCRRLVLAATSPGSIMVPGKPSVLLKMISPRRYADPSFMARVGGDIYGGAYRRDPGLLREHSRHIQAPGGRGYLYQLLAIWGWSSLPWLSSLHQPTLVMHGKDDPIVPLVNAKILATRIPRARLHVIDDGHLFLVARAAEAAPIIEEFLSQEK